MFGYTIIKEIELEKLENNLERVRNCNDDNITWKWHWKNMYEKLLLEKKDSRYDKLLFFKRVLHIKLREYKHQFELADEIGMDRSMLSAIKKGHYIPNEAALDVYIKDLKNAKGK